MEGRVREKKLAELADCRFELMEKRDRKMGSPPARVGFPEGRIVPGLCAEGPRTLCPQGESRRAETGKSSKEMVENSAVQVVSIQLVTPKNGKDLAVPGFSRPA